MIRCIADLIYKAKDALEIDLITRGQQKNVLNACLGTVLGATKKAY